MQNRDDFEPSLYPALPFGTLESLFRHTLCAVWSGEADVLDTELIGDAALNIDTPSEQKLGVMQTCPFPDKLSETWLYVFVELILQYVCFVGR